MKAPASAAPKLTVLDARGAVVRTMTGTNFAGINRVYWDLRYDPSKQVTLRTSPMYAPYIVPGPNGRPAPGTNTLSILAPPGRYTVKVEVNGTTQTQPVVVRKDPNSGGTELDIAAQTRALVAVRSDLNEAAGAVEQIELVRVQLDSIARGNGDAEAKKAADAFHQKVTDLEMNLVDLRLTGGGQDGVRFGAKLISKLGYLANGLSASDNAPTTQAVEVQRVLKQDLTSQLSSLDALLRTDLAGLNQVLTSKGLPAITVRPRGPVMH
jgi:hypothetical protein